MNYINSLTDREVYELGVKLAREGHILHIWGDTLCALTCFREILKRDRRRPSEVHMCGGYDGDIVGADDHWRDCIHYIDWSNDLHCYEFIKEALLIDNELDNQ